MLALTDEIVEAEQVAGKFSVVLHNHPYAGTDTSINQFCHITQYTMDVCCFKPLHTKWKDLGSHVVQV